MKKILFIPVLLFIISLKTFSQQDTTKLQIGKKKFIIIENDYAQKRDIGDLEESIANFENWKETEEIKLKEIETEIKETELELENQNLSASEKEGLTKRLENKNNELQDIKKKISSMDKGISELKIAIEELKKEENKNDTILVEDKDDVLNKLNNRKFNGHWTGVGIGLSNYMTKEYSFELDPSVSFMKLNPEKSFNLCFNIKEFNFALTKNKMIPTWGVLTGFGLDYRSFSFYENITLSEGENDILTAEYIDKAEKKFTRNKLTSTYLSVPLFLEYSSSGKSGFHFELGLIGGLRLWSKYKQKYDEGSKSNKNKVRDDFYQNPFQCAVTARIGLRNISLYANYNLLPLFRAEQGPELYAVNLGVTYIY